MTQRERSIFEHCALASGLLTEQQLDEARAGVRWSASDEPDPNAPPSDKQLADRLVEVGLLNVWQVRQLRNGRTKFNLGPYLIIDSVGQGGMGHVFKARHSVQGSIVAIKVLPHDKSTPEAVQSFAQEVRATSNLHHPRLVAAYDAGQDGSVHYLVTEYVPGMDLRKWVRRKGALSMTVAASIISQVAEGLQYAHTQGLVHRDVKPGNVLVTPQGEAKLSDLGLAQPLLIDAENDPRYGKIVGTADYISPDQVHDPYHPNPAWDIYSLGCTLYYATTGKVPFPGGTTADKARAHCELRPLNPRRLNANLSAEFVDIMADMMAKDPEERIPSAEEVIARLARFLPGQAKVTAAIAPPPVAMPALDDQTVQTPAPPAPRLVLAWPPSEMEADISRFLGGSADDPGSTASTETFDLDLLNDEMPSLVVPVPGHEEEPKADWSTAILVLALLGLAGFMWWLIRIY